MHEPLAHSHIVTLELRQIRLHEAFAERGERRDDDRYTHECECTQDERTGVQEVFTITKDIGNTRISEQRSDRDDEPKWIIPIKMKPTESADKT